ncbi:MAG TPA: carboxypeptidase M32 [Planctomycetaceae bacterium]|nr:carboxypeptidase M32 [Planctomycetaceae bacterium]
MQRSLETIFSELRDYCYETSLLEAAAACLEWDERTGLPLAAGAYRAEQMTLLAGMVHERKTAKEFEQLLQDAGELSAATDNSPTSAAVRRLLKEHDRNQKLPIELVKATSKATVLGQQAWEKARQADDWKLFEPHLKEIYNLRRQEAEILAGDGHLYDALLDQYEEGAKSEQLTQTFAALRDALVPLVNAMSQSSTRPDGQSFRIPIPVEYQRNVSHWVAAAVGYDFERGRLDETSHPFCTTLGPHDCRILTRYHEDYFATSFYGTLHEAGHGIYEQGLPTEWYGLAPGQAAGLGFHESQSRLWENFVGRSQEFWRWALHEVDQRIGGAWKGRTAETVYRDANLVQPSLIRVEADEVTYNLHIMIRFEIEQALLSGDLPISDAPDAWNSKYQEYLGITPPTHRDGILQDVHWSAGLVGYFPTYTLGNIFAAQLMESAADAIGDIPKLLERGEFQPLMTWLRKHVHEAGACYVSEDLVRRVTGKPTSSEPLIKYLKSKLSPIYDL